MSRPGEPRVFCVVLESLRNFQILQAKLQNLSLPPCNSSPTFFHNNSQPWHVFHLLLVQPAQRSDELVDLHSHDKLSVTHLQKPLTTYPNQLQRSGTLYTPPNAQRILPPRCSSSCRRSNSCLAARMGSCRLCLSPVVGDQLKSVAKEVQPLDRLAPN